jgi:hypothetical protein
MRCLFLTDSLALPRKYRTCTVTWDETYIRLLARARPADEFIHAGIGGATISELLLQLDYYVHAYPDVVVLHCGIVDCAPRALRKWELQIAGKLGLYRAIKPLSTPLRRYRNIQYTSPARFAAALESIRSRFPGKPLAAIGILPTRPGHEAIVPGVSARIRTYNGLLAARTHFIDTSDFPDAGMIEDFVHMNAAGHRVLFEKVNAALDRLDGAAHA